MNKLKGGHKFSLFAGVAESRLDTCPVPGSVILPRSLSGQTWSPMVSDGSTVRAGEPLLATGDDSGRGRSTGGRARRKTDPGDDRSGQGVCTKGDCPNNNPRLRRGATGDGGAGGSGGAQAVT